MNISFFVSFFWLTDLFFIIDNTIFGAKYSIMDQGKLVKDNL